MTVTQMILRVSPNEILAKLQRGNACGVGRAMLTVTDTDLNGTPPP